MPTISENPNETSARANRSEATYRFPLNETLPVATRLRFVKYSRWTPADAATDETTAVITMPLPITIPDTSSISTTTVNLGLLGNMSQENLAKVQSMSESAEGTSAGDVAKLGYSLLKDNLARNAAMIRNSSLQAIATSPYVNDAIRTNAQALIGVTQNPHTATLFEGVNLKSFNLEWRLSARSEDESEAIRNIINTIKTRIHPEELAGGFALDFPDLVHVEFSGKVDRYLPKFSKAFVNNFVATPDSSGGLSLFKSGAPVNYNIQLQLTEISIHTRQTLEEQIGE